MSSSQVNLEYSWREVSKQKSDVIFDVSDQSLGGAQVFLSRFKEDTPSTQDASFLKTEKQVSFINIIYIYIQTQCEGSFL